MKLRRAGWVLAGIFALAAWQNRDLLRRDPPLTTRFNEQATAINHVPSYTAASAVMPQTQQEIWAIRIGSRPMALGGHHLFLEFAPADQKAHPHKSDGHIFQIHGVAMDRATKNYVRFDFDKFQTYRDYFTHSEALKVVGINRNFDEGVVGHEPDSYTDVYYGPKDEVLKMYMDAMTMGDEINAEDLDYGILTQNSNSVVRSLLEGIGVPAPDIFEAGGIRAHLEKGHIWTPAFNLSLVPRDWSRQQARDTYHYDGLFGDALEKAAVKAAHGEMGIWPDPKLRHHRTHGERRHFDPGGPT
jgi:hypothetical protein